MKRIEKKKPLFSKIIFPMIMLSMLQIIIIVAAMVISGEFSSIKKFSYNSISDKTEYRKNYVENALNQKTSPVYETAEAVNDITDHILQENHVSGSAILQDKELNKQILSESVDSLVSLLRRDMVNDVFIILNTDGLYNEGDTVKMTGLYLRDVDVSADSAADNGDIYMEVGSSVVARDMGFALDYEWTLLMDMTEREDCNFDFFYDTIAGYHAEPEMPLEHYGKWSPFSSISPSTEPSMKYTLPLISEDGTVYGIIGIGLMKKTVLQSIPASDFFDDSACYILAVDSDSNGIYEEILSSGPAYGRLVDDNTVLSRDNPSEYGVYDFTSRGIECIGSIQDMTLYSAASYYNDQSWALISIAEKERALSISNMMIRLFAISLMISLLAGVLIAFFMSRSVSSPVTKMLRELEFSQRNNAIVQFSSSGISEIDDLADSIVELQVSVTEYASRVSKIIAMAGSEIGVFMYDFRNKSVFVGESLIKLLQFEALPERDVTISMGEFRSQLATIDTQNRLLSLGIFTMADDAEIASDSLQIMYTDPEDGTVRWFEFDLIKDNKNVMGLVKDITSTVTEKEQIAKGKDDEYTEKLLKVNAALRDAYAAATQANSAKTDFLSRMSHDIRTPMNAIIGMTAIAERYLDKPDKLEECLKKIDVSSHYLLSLINEVLDMSKIESGKFVLSEENIYIPDMIDNILEIIRPGIKDKHHDMKVDVAELEHKYVIGDGMRLQQAFVNILSNAVKYTPPGGHIEWLVTEKPSHKKKIGYYEFVFRDDGIGMSKEFLERLYEPFERASDVRVNKETGTGLGMSITKNIIEMMDGDIHVESAVGKGTTFTVTIVMKLQEKEEVQNKQSSASDADQQGKEKRLDRISKSDFSGRRVLLVDDNEINREIACEILGMSNLEVEIAENGQEAVDKFAASEEGWYQMIFMDVQMPVMNGYDASAAIRSLNRRDAGTVPIVAMTADAFAEDVKAAKKAGMNEHIAKPLDFNRLLEILNHFLG